MQQQSFTVIEMDGLIRKAICFPVLFAWVRIRDGKLVPTILGAIIGGTVGATLRFAAVSLMGFGIAVGMLVGAAISASLFPRRDSLYEIETENAHTRHQPDGTSEELPACLTRPIDEIDRERDLKRNTRIRRMGGGSDW